jgi:hypothetical protein
LCKCLEEFPLWALAAVVLLARLLPALRLLLRGLVLRGLPEPCAALLLGALGVEDEEAVDDLVLEGLEGLLLGGGGGAERGTTMSVQP